MTDAADTSETGPAKIPATARPHSAYRFDVDAPRDKSEKLEEWMLTYMDTVTLLVTLFVLILSFASISEEKYAELVEGLRLDKYGPGFMTGSTGVMDMPGVHPEPKAPEAAEDRTGVEERLQDLITEKGLNDLVSIGVSDGLLDLRLQDSVLFPSGSAALLDSGREVLSRLIPILSSGKFEISVHGHTDSVPISTAEFPSNWELSGSRAASVVRALEAMGIDENRLAISGFAHTRPVGDNKTEEGRAKNRRVNIQLHVTPEETEAILGGRG